MQSDKDYLLKLVQIKMPFGKYKGRLLIDLPEPYIVWLSQKGFKNDSLGKMLQAVYEIKLNGLEYLLEPIRSDEQQFSVKAGNKVFYNRKEKSKERID